MIFFLCYGGLKIAILANFGQITRDLLRAINEEARLNPSQKSFQIGSRKLKCHNCFVNRSKIYHFVLNMACVRIFSRKNLRIFLKMILNFFPYF